MISENLNIQNEVVVGVGSCKDTDIIIPYGVSAIGDYAFNQCRGIHSVSIPNSVKSIGKWAFGNTFLRRVVIPESVIHIDEFAFAKTPLTDIVIPKSATHIGIGVFAESHLTRVKIPHTWERINASMFSHCENLTIVIVFDHLKHIDDFAFENCCNLQHIIYSGTRAQWNAIIKAPSWNIGTGNYTIQCSDGNMTKIPQERVILKERKPKKKHKTQAPKEKVKEVRPEEKSEAQAPKVEVKVVRSEAKSEAQAPKVEVKEVRPEEKSEAQAPKVEVKEVRPEEKSEAQAPKAEVKVEVGGNMKSYSVLCIPDLTEGITLTSVIVDANDPEEAKERALEVLRKKGYADPMIAPPVPGTEHVIVLEVGRWGMHSESFEASVAWAKQHTPTLESKVEYGRELFDDVVNMLIIAGADVTGAQWIVTRTLMYFVSSIFNREYGQYELVARICGYIPNAADVQDLGLVEAFLARCNANLKLKLRKLAILIFSVDDILTLSEAALYTKLL